MKSIATRLIWLKTLYLYYTYLIYIYVCGVNTLLFYFISKCFQSVYLVSQTIVTLSRSLYVIQHSFIEKDIDIVKSMNDSL